MSKEGLRILLISLAMLGIALLVTAPCMMLMNAVRENEAVANRQFDADFRSGSIVLDAQAIEIGESNGAKHVDTARNKDGKFVGVPSGAEVLEDVPRRFFVRTNMCRKIVYTGKPVYILAATTTTPGATIVKVTDGIVEVCAYDSLNGSEVFLWVKR